MHCFYTCISLKIQMKVAWNLKGAGITGYSASEDELKVLHDVYSTAVQPGSQKASYIVQFLWRDLTSGFDLIGPYFPIESSMSSSVLQELITLRLKAFSSYGVKVAILLCDGASSNLTVLKLLSGNPKAHFLVNSDAETEGKIPCGCLIHQSRRSTSKPSFSDDLSKPQGIIINFFCYSVPVYFYFLWNYQYHEMSISL